MEKFNKGQEVEVTSQEPGFEDSWYVATITRRLKNSKYHVEYQSLVDETESYIPLKETVAVVQLRPLPPKQATRPFELNEEVDAFLSDGWWKGVITKIVIVGSRYSVFFSPAKEEQEFDQSELRAHLDWILGKWVSPTSQIQKMVVRGQDERSFQSPNPTGQSALSRDVETPQTPNVVREPSQETKLQGLRGVDSQTEKLLEKKRGRPPGRPPSSSKIESMEGKKRKSGSTKALHRTFQSKDMDTPQTPNGVSDPAQEIKLQGLGDVDSQMEVVLEKKRGRPIRSSKKQKTGSTKASRRTSQSKDMGTPNGANDLAQEIKLQGLGALDNQTEKVLEKRRGRPRRSSNIESVKGKKQKSGSTKALRRTPQLKGLGNESAVKGMEDVQSACKPSLSRSADEHQLNSMFLEDSQSYSVKDIGGFEHASTIKQMTDIQAEYTPLSSRIFDEHQPISTLFKKFGSHIEKDIGGLVDKEIANVLKRKHGSPKRSTNKESVKGPGKECASKEVMGFPMECKSLSSHIAEERQPPCMFPEKLSSQSNGGVSPADDQLMPNMVESSCLEECTAFTDHHQCENASADERASHSVGAEESLPFIKNSHLWGILDSMEVFRMTPQQPHFLPLREHDEELREGHAVGHMLNFANLVERTRKAKLEDPRSMLENKLKALPDLEELGFAVQPIRVRLEELLRIKDRCSQLEDKSKAAYVEVDEEKRKLEEVQKCVLQLNKKLETLLMEQEMKGSNIAQLQKKMEVIKERIQGVKLDFDTLVRSPLV